MFKCRFCCSVATWFCGGMVGEEGRGGEREGDGENYIEMFFRTGALLRSVSRQSGRSHDLVGGLGRHTMEEKGRRGGGREEKKVVKIKEKGR